MEQIIANSHQPSRWKLFVDGASRNNPGPSGAGIYILKNNVLFIKSGFYLGIKTNNQAEYLALLIGLLIIKEHIQQHDTLHVVSDSQLLVRQLLGEYKVRNPQLQPLYSACKHNMIGMDAMVTHVLRAENSEADLMANEGVDTQVFPPQKYIAQLQNYDISL